ncbi:MAG: hypothetical protein ACRBC3_00265 [Burkholderiaceae bacterium]
MNKRRLPPHFSFCWQLIVITALTLPFSVNTAAQSKRTLGKPELSVLVSNQDHARINQQIIQQIRIETAYPFDSLRVELGTIANAETVELHTPTTRAFESWGVEGFVYETSRAIFAQHPGELILPMVTARGRFTDDLGVEHSFKLSHEPETVPIQGRAIELINEPWLVASEVRISEQWSTDPHQLKAGEVAQRIVTAEVVGSLAEMITAMVMPTGTGIQVLPGPVTRRNDITDRGVTGTITQQYDVRIASEQLSDIPPMQLIWWNDQKQRVDRSTVRGWRIEPILPQRSSLVRDLLDQAQQGRDRGRALLLLLVVPALILTLLIRIIARRQQRWSAMMRRASKVMATSMLGPVTELPDIGFSRIQRATSASQSLPARSGVDD